VEVPVRGDRLERPVLRERHPEMLEDLVEEDLDPMLEAAGRGDGFPRRCVAVVDAHRGLHTGPRRHAGGPSTP
jgi:hypothetical protein